MAVSMRKIENDTELHRLLNRVFTSPLRTAYVEIGEDKHCMPIYYQDYEERLRKFAVQDDDVYILGQPKTGTTWCHELVWMLINDLDYEGAELHTVLRCPLLEMSAIFDFKTMALPELGGQDLLKFLEILPGRRSIKSHLPWNLLPEQIQNGSKTPKIVLTFRNIKDTCVSNFHQVRASEGYKGTFEEYCELYMGGRAPNTPFWPHVFGLWEQRHRPNILVIRYEEMKSDLLGTIKKMAAFLDKTLTKEQLEKLAKNLSFESMKNNDAMNVNSALDAVNKDFGLTVAQTEFIRSGKVGDHKSLMTPELVKRFDDWVTANTAGTDFPYKL